MSDTITVKSPCRINFAGGFTDLEEYYNQYGGAIVEAAINIYATASIRGRDDDLVTVKGWKFGVDEHGSISDLSGIRNFYRVVIEHFSPKKGFDLTLDSDVMYSSGIGSSSASIVAIISAFNEWLELKMDNYAIAELAHSLERGKLNIYAGKQDAYAAAFSGLNYMEFTDEKVTVERLNLKTEVVEELRARIVVANTMMPRVSENLIKDLVKKINAGDWEVLERLDLMKSCAKKIATELRNGNLDRIGDLMSEDWTNKKLLNKEISNPKVERIFKIALENGAEGGKLLGAGSGGHVFFFAEAGRREELANVLKKEGLIVYAAGFSEAGDITPQWD